MAIPMPKPALLLALACLCVPYLFAPVPLRAQPAGGETGDREAGRRLAITWCSNCHLVSPPAAGAAQDSAPPFATIAHRPSTTRAGLLAFLQAPHRPMPDYNLARQQQEDLVAYLLSLRH